MASRLVLFLTGMGREFISVCERIGILLDAAGRRGSASLRHFGKRT
jgi:hypothetical protein